jgi:hypothetical protein
MDTNEQNKNASRRDLLFKYLRTPYEMDPYNAAIAAGYDHTQAKAIELRCKLPAAMHTGLKDLLQQEGLSIRRLIRHLIKKAGLNESEFGAMRSMVCDGGVVEVEDERLQRGYLETLMELCDLKKVLLGIKEDEEEDKNKVFDIIFNVSQGPEKKEVSGPEKKKAIDIEFTVDNKPVEVEGKEYPKTADSMRESGEKEESDDKTKGDEGPGENAGR